MEVIIKKSEKRKNRIIKNESAPFNPNKVKIKLIGRKKLMIPTEYLVYDFIFNISPLTFTSLIL
jgi:hypothetical protein